MLTQPNKSLFLIPDDKYHFKMSKKQGDTDKNPIVLDNVASTTTKATQTAARPEPTAEQAIEAQRALDKQQATLAALNKNMNKKLPAAVSPGEDGSRKKKQKTTKDPSSMDMKITTVQTTKTIKDKNGVVMAVKTTEEISRPPTKQESSLHHRQSTLLVYRFTGPDPNSAKVIPIYQAKVVKKKNREAKEKELDVALKGLNYVTVNDDPLTLEVNKLVRESNVIFLNIKEVEEDKNEPRYFVWDWVEAIKGLGREDETIHPTCTDCFYDTCHGYLWGPYYVAAVERYFKENHYIANERVAYVIYVAHYNHRLDVHSYDGSGAAERLRPTQITKPPKCMKEGSLRHCIRWIKWQRTCGPYADWYSSQHHRRERSRQTNEAK